MNKFFKTILLIILLTCLDKIYAYEVTYSQWSDVYPSNIEEELIQSEDRYLWYKEKEGNIEYLIKEKIGDKLVDYNDYIYSEESKPSSVKPEEYEERVINTKTSTVEYSDNDVSSLRISNINFIDEIYVSEIDVLDKNNMNKLNYNTNKTELNDNNYDNYILNNDDLVIEFDELKDINNLLIKIYYRCNCNNTNTFNFSALSNDGYDIYSNDYSVSNCILEIDKSKLNSNLTKTITEYTYVDKLYKTHSIVKDITDEYYVELDGYEKLESSVKTFYRYITNDYLYFSTYGDIVYNESYCRKNRCIKKYYNHEIEEEQENIINPQTNDNIEDYFVLLIVGFIVIVSILLIKLVTLMNKKSSFVESI